jgi:teichuronic acid biosynthesis glycosyltransferase TuaH
VRWLHALGRRCFWALPAVVRHRLHGVRHAIVRLLRLAAGRQSGLDSDLDWPAFYAAALEPLPRTIIVFAPNIDWGVTLYQRPQHLAAALARQGCLVLYRTHGDGVGGFRRVAPGLWLCNDPAVDQMSGVVTCLYSTSLGASVRDLSRARQRGTVVYEYIDHLDGAISGGAGAVRRLTALRDAALSGEADLIVVSAAALQAEVHTVAPSLPCAYVPNGVDVEHYRAAHHRQALLPVHLRSFRARYERVIGYFGAIAPWLWYDMLDTLSAALPEIGFAFVGPDYSGCVPRLPQRANVLYIGAVDYAVLPGYGHTFDACLIPFKPGPVARSTSPLKLYEYFALEKPVVVTADMLECTAFPEVFSGHDVVTLRAAILQAFLAGHDLGFRQRLAELADANSWDLRARQYLTALRQCGDVPCV